MSPLRFLSLPLRYRPWRPAHLRLVARDALGVARSPERSHEVHLEAAIDWLCRAQDVRDGEGDAGGVSAGWSFEDGWLPSYPETSGYIVETLVAAARRLRRPELLARAHRILDWELSLQTPDGAFPGHFGEAGSEPVIFNTGQIMHGLVAGHIELGRGDCWEPALRAGRWMVERQDPDGCWRRSEHNGVPHTYNTRAAWALLRVGLLAGEREFQEGARRNFEWALSQQTSSAWFATNAFLPGRAPFTHTIAYAMRGLLEGGALLGEARFVDAADRAARALARAQRTDGWLCGAFGDGWVPAARYCCLTGLAQTVLVWERLAQETGAHTYADSIRRGLSYLKRNQAITKRGDPEDGGIAGSAPIWGAYSRFEYPNWAAKFFADALMMDLEPSPIPCKQGRCSPSAGVAAGA